MKAPSGEPTPISGECDAALDYLYAMLEGERKTRFEAHLRTCARCQAELESFGRVRVVAQAALPAPHTMEESPRLTGPLHAQLMHAAVTERPKKGRVLPFVRRVMSQPGYAVAATVLIIGGAAGLQLTRGHLLMAPKSESVAAPVTAAAPAPAASSPTGLAKPAEPVAEEEANDKRAAARPEADPSIDTKSALDSHVVKLAKTRSSDSPATKDALELAPGFGSTEGSRTRNEYKTDLPATLPTPSRVAAPAPKLDDLVGGAVNGLGGGRGGLKGGVGGKASGAGYQTGAKEVGAAQGPALADRDAAPNAAPVTTAPAKKALAEAPAERKPAPEAAEPMKNMRHDDDAYGEADKSRRAAADSPPRPPARAQVAQAPSSSANTGESLDGTYARNQAVGSTNAAPAQNAAVAPSDEESGKVAREKSEQAPDAVDAERHRAVQLAQAGRCDEASAVFEGLERRVPERLNAQDRLTYERCLRVLGRLEPAQNQLNQLNRQRVTLPKAAINAEQRALDTDRKRQVASEAQAQAAPPAAHAAKAKKAPASKNADQKDTTKNRAY